jgi:GT2 family glycosyltransferase
MEKDTQHEFRRLVPEWAKSYYRALRARLLSLGLRPAGPIPLSGQERQASGTISVVVTVHDAPEVTRRCLSSLETFSGDAEVIIVDDGSRLESAKFMLNAFCSRNGWKLVRNDVALGHSRASEAGISVSMKPFICLLNSDTVVTPRSWLGIARAFDDSPQIAAVGPSTSHTPTPQRVLRAYHCRHYWSDEQIWCFAEQYVARHRKEPVVDLPYVGGFAFFVRRAIWDEMGGFDKHLPDYGNELEFCRRLTRRGLRIVWSKTSYIHHLGNESYGRTIGLA